MENNFTIATISEVLRSGELNARRVMIEYLWWLQGNIDFFPATLVRELLNDADDEIKIMAIEILSQVPQFLGEPYISMMITNLKNENRQVRDAVVKALIALGDKISRENVLSIIPLLAHWNMDVRISAAEALVELLYLVRMDEVINEVVPLLWDANETVRADTAVFLADVGQDDILNQLSINQY